MPIKSKAEWGYLAANHPGLLHKFAHETKTPYAKLPARVKKNKKRKN